MNNEKNNTMLPRWQIIGWLYVFIYAALIFFLSSLSSPSKVPLPQMGDKVIHFIEYAFFGFLLFRAFGSGVTPVRSLIFSFFLASLYGVGDELHQYFVPTRDADPMDVVADSTGGLIGGYAAYLIRTRRLT